MRHLLARILLGLVVVGVTWLAWPRSQAAGLPAGLAAAAEAASPAPEDHGWSADADKSAEWQGVASCVSSSCHGQNGGKGTKGSEYNTWAGYDKHARAFQVLGNERSERMVRNLYGTDAKPAMEQALCLKCHASHDGITATGVAARFQLNDGVGCESCHGAAAKWLTIHYQGGFKDKSLKDKAALGMRPTKDIAYRARVCTECHVGTANKEVNHDLIAAGHPRLAFEFGAYHGIYNKHWNIQADHDRYPDFEARAWAVGQLVSARAALELLKARADGAANGTKPWPEFAEYECFACHKDLQVNSPRQKAGYGDRKAGSLPWGNWYLSPTNPLLGEGGQKPSEALTKLRSRLQSASPDAREVGLAAAALAREVDDLRTEASAAPARSAGAVREKMDRLARFGEGRIKGMSWDEATQLYLALAALENALTDMVPGTSTAIQDDLRKVAQNLRQAFPEGSDSPTRFNPAGLDVELKSIRDRLGK